jgi:hypothetical protein
MVFAAGNYAAAVALLFPLIGIGLAGWAIRAWLQLKRFKTPTLLLQRLPVALGGRLKGHGPRRLGGTINARSARSRLYPSTPAEQPATSMEDGDGTITWRLEVTGACPGPDFWSRFELPVFATGEAPAPNDTAAAAAARS